MRIITAVKMPNGQYMGWDHDIFDKMYKDPADEYVYDRSGYLYEKDANPWKAEGGQLVEIVISGVETGKTNLNLYKNGELIEERDLAEDTDI